MFAWDKQKLYGCNVHPEMPYLSPISCTREVSRVALRVTVFCESPEVLWMNRLSKI